MIYPEQEVTLVDRFSEMGYQEVPEQPDVAQAERAALEARIREAESYRVGAPDQMHDTPLHTQGDAPDCLLEAARMAEQRQTGIDPGLEAYKDSAIEKGIYDPNEGTDLQGFVDVVNERPGVEGELTYADGPEDIKRALDNGESVIAGLDSYEYYKDQFNLEPNSGGHAVVVTGADQTGDGSWEFAVNDPNFETPNMPVEGERFLRAWEAMNRPMITIRGTGGA